MSRAKKTARFASFMAVAFCILPWVIDGVDKIPWPVVWVWIITAQIWLAADWLLKAARGEDE